MLSLHLASGLRLLKLEIGQTQLPFALGFNQVLPGLAFLAMERLDLSVAQNREVVPGRKHATLVGDQGLGAALFRQGRVEPLQKGGEGLMRRDYPRQKLPGIAFDNADAVDPAAIQLDQGANLGASHVMTLLGTIGQRLEAGLGGLLISGTAPGPRRAVALAIDGQRSAHRPLTRGWFGALWLQ
jgi:hypothetical protein